MKKGYSYIILAILLILPILWIVFWGEAKHSAKKLPIYFERQVGENGDTIYHTIPYFSFINQDGDSVTPRTFENSVYVANFFFATCKDVCPNMNRNLSMVVSHFKNQDNVKFISHTVHPEHDSVEVLKEYAKRFKAETPKWNFVTGKKRELYKIAAEGYKVNAAQQMDGEVPNFFHTEKLILVDKQGRVRGVFESGDMRELKNLEDAIKALLFEYNEPIVN